MPNRPLAAWSGRASLAWQAVGAQDTPGSAR
jgi:hypothetical protein